MCSSDLVGVLGHLARSTIIAEHEMIGVARAADAAAVPLLGVMLLMFTITCEFNVVVVVVIVVIVVVVFIFVFIVVVVVFEIDLVIATFTEVVDVNHLVVLLPVSGIVVTIIIVIVVVVASVRATDSTNVSRCPC